MEKKVLLIILDGFGHSKSKDHNAILMAKTPVWTGLLQNNSHTLLKTAGKAVGLPEGIMGNSEVGHLNIGGGRIIPQELTRIANFAKQNGFESLPDIKRVMEDCEGALHLIGLLSDGGVHSDQEHLHLLVEAANRVAPKKKVFIHVIADGRDTPPKSAINYVQQLQKHISHFPQVKIATVMGRFFAMDRDKRWDRVKAAYDCYVGSPSVSLPGTTVAHQICEFETAELAVLDGYGKSETDEFLVPRRISGGANFTPKDQVVFFNFRADRAREISMAFGLSNFTEFSTAVKINPKNWITFTSYQKDFPFPVLFAPATYSRILGEEVERHNKKQLRIAETEKYAHVTYFFNGGAEKPFDGEDRILVPSPKEVATYDLKPEMSAGKVTDDLVAGLKTGNYTLVVCNYANGDMVGHTGNEIAAIKAVETLDECLGRVVPVATSMGYDVLVTADHGNCEQMIEPTTGAPFTQHTTNPVPLVHVSSSGKKSSLNSGILADIAPTILEILGWEKPAEMTGRSLLSPQ